MLNIPLSILRVNPHSELVQTYRDLYTTGGGLRVDTSEPAVSSTTQGFTRPLPGVGKLVVPPVEEEEGEEQDGDGEQEE